MAPTSSITPPRDRSRSSTGRALTGRLAGLASFSTLVAISLAVCGVSWSQSELSPAAQSEIEASFVYTLAKFVKWPTQAFGSNDSPIIFCALGDGSFGSALERQVRGKTISGRVLSYRGLTRAQDLETCHVLVLGDSSPDELQVILGRLSGTSVMTVCNEEGFARLGGIVGLRLNQGMVQAEINIAMARRGGLQISSRFLNLSGIVKVRTHSGGD
ncbi:MAG: YfiR family protein [Chloroflexi bacterium]|nr:MAG: YfiR family protein [Chloroflexota bacterium]